MPEISVIIPVYNVEKYLSECLDSVINQTFKDIEIICVDDGSTDNSAYILKQYAQKDKRIKIITQKNSGVVTARNNAIKQAVGKYIFPLDSDDFINIDTLEKCYKAIQNNLGDIITFRVMMFGTKFGELILPKPNKYNMSLQNCAVNAALFKKSDFEKTGGYSPEYNLAIEDYDLWLNFIFKQNKKIYRIPEILFHYRIKEANESRNLQHISERHNLENTLIIKYPQMSFYKKLYNLTSPFRKIVRFLFRIKHNKIRICKIPVYTFRKYDSVISVGAACFVADVIKSEKLRNFSGPFDWMYGGNVICRFNLILNEFKNYFNYEDFEFIGENPENGKIIYKNTKTELVYNHDFPQGNFSDIFTPVARKYKRRIERTLWHLNNDKKVLLVYSELHSTGNTTQITNIINKINLKYKAQIDLLYINHNPTIKVGSHTKLKQISKHIFYSEYHYDKFPEELPQATRILTKLLKKVAK